MSHKCPCGEAYNTAGTCVRCDNEFIQVVDEMQTGLIFPVCYDHKVFDKSCVKCYADSLRVRATKDAELIKELEDKLKALTSIEMLKLMKTFNISQVRLRALIFMAKKAKESKSKIKQEGIEFAKAIMREELINHGVLADDLSHRIDQAWNRDNGDT